jgi:hypothetical protein
MHGYSLTHLVDAVLLRDLVAMVTQERAGLARMLALIAEVDARRLYAPAGYSSMHAYLVGELRFSDDAAFKRIQAARVARRFPILYTAIAEGGLHMLASAASHSGECTGARGGGHASAAAGDRSHARSSLAGHVQTGLRQSGRARDSAQSTCPELGGCGTASRLVDIRKTCGQRGRGARSRFLSSFATLVEAGARLDAGGGRPAK